MPLANFIDPKHVSDFQSFGGMLSGAIDRRVDQDYDNEILKLMTSYLSPDTTEAVPVL